MRTTHCIVCGSKKIVKSVGHVHFMNDKIIASFCREHKETSVLNRDCKGCYGTWLEWMGSEKFGEVCFIDRAAVR